MEKDFNALNTYIADREVFALAQSLPNFESSAMMPRLLRGFGLCCQCTIVVLFS